jgi:hypothetical protein
MWTGDTVGWGTSHTDWSSHHPWGSHWTNSALLWMRLYLNTADTTRTGRHHRRCGRSRRASYESRHGLQTEWNRTKSTAWCRRPEMSRSRSGRRSGQRRSSMAAEYRQGRNARSILRLNHVSLATGDVLILFIVRADLVLHGVIPAGRTPVKFVSSTFPFVIWIWLLIRIISSEKSTRCMGIVLFTKNEIQTLQFANRKSKFSYMTIYTELMYRYVILLHVLINFHTEVEGSIPYGTWSYSQKKNTIAMTKWIELYVAALLGSKMDATAGFHWSS